MHYINSETIVLLMNLLIFIITVIEKEVSFFLSLSMCYTHYVDIIFINKMTTSSRLVLN
jgi:hypothetical protein